MAYLFERYTDELLIQTLLLLARGGNLEVTAQMKYHIDKWGKARYGEEVWPGKVRDELPALFLGITGIDEEFRNRDEYADEMLYETRLAQLADALGPVMNDFGGKGLAFSNVYPIRYPGTWDANEQQRNKSGAEKWTRAGEAFSRAKLVRRHIASAPQKWEAAMDDQDGGMSLISEGWRQVTTATRKQDQLEASINDVRARLEQLAQGWVVNPDANIDRQQRLDCAQRVLDWLASDKQAIYDRVQVLEKSLGFEDGDQWQLSDFADMPTRTSIGRPDSLERRFPKQLREFFHEWATINAPNNWDEQTVACPQGGPWLASEDFAAMVRYFRDALCAGEMFDEISGQLLKVVNLKLRDESAKRRARRKYVGIMLNDYVTSPGVNASSSVALTEDDDEFGLMGQFVARWREHLPKMLTSGAADEVRIPPGNAELIELLQSYQINVPSLESE